MPNVFNLFGFGAEENDNLKNFHINRSKLLKKT